MELPAGLEEILELAFTRCTSLHSIIIPPAVTVIPHGAFSHCLWLTDVTLPEGLEKIERNAFHTCTSLNAIVIPSSVMEIHEKAFLQCSELTHVQFCREIEEFISGESMRGWWNGGVLGISLLTYSFFVQCNIPKRVGLVEATSWRRSIHDMLSRIPSITRDDLISYFLSIDSKLFLYENLKDAPLLLELAINQSSGIVNTNIDAILNGDLISRVLSYLTEGDWEEILYQVPNSILGRAYITKRKSTFDLPIGFMELRNI